jgi:cytochrome c-type biogenesis protein
MNGLEPFLHDISALTPLAVGVVALAGLIVGIAPSSFPLISVAAGLAVRESASRADRRRLGGLWLSSGFALGIATVDAVIGALFGLAGFAVLRLLASYLSIAYLLLAIFVAGTGLALLRVIHIVLPVIHPSVKPARTFLGSFLLGLPFGLSTCPACTPLILPVVAAAASTADPLLGATLMATFGVARGVPIVAAGVVAGTLPRLGDTRRYMVQAERVAGVLMLAAALYFAYQAIRYAGWLAG